MKLFRHPLHVLLIHFPTALLPMDLILSYLFFRTGDQHFGYAAFYCLAGGVAMGLLSGLTGLIDLVMIKDKETLSTALVHGSINLTAVLVFAVLAYKGWNLYPQVQVPTVLLLTVKLLAVSFMLVGNYFGGKLIFKHHLAIESHE